ncbi:MAG TPA: sigma factor-like helix-turn-helix DNA-binding protein [Solirubrobacteraceae bacterium]|nr:sigma factor-like helix-turn-helix DNA-binding protein [Solirubrobacteraceae bacterium]
MASLETLTPDQRAVLDLVLRRGRSYDDIAQLLAIDRAAVRARALAAFDAIGPETGISPESRALVTDYLLGQLPERVAEETRERLAESPYDRAWARVVASELEPLAAEPLPEIPDGSRARTSPSTSPAAEAAAPTAPAREARRRRPPRLSDRPSSRRGGAIMLGVGVLVVVAVVVVLLTVIGGGSSKKQPTTAASTPSRTTTTTAAGSTGSTTGTTGQAKIVAQVNLNPPSGTGSTKGVGLVVKDGSAYGLIIEAQDVAPNSHNAYAVWLYNSSSDTLRLGFVNPAVGKTGKLQVGTGLPTNAGHYKELLLTLETQSAPKTPGQVVLEGPFKGVPATG